MNVDKANLKALAEASGPNQWYSAGDLRYCDDKTGEIHGLHHDDSRFIAAASPATVLALLAEIERLDRESQNLSNQLGHCDRERRVFRAERDQLKAENEALRKDAERYRFVRNPIGTSSPLAIWNEGKMPLFSSMADAVVDEFMAKEASHD